MRFITGLVFLANTALWIAAIVGGFTILSWSLGLPIIIGFIAYLIAWSISGDMVTSIADFLFQPEWDVFLIKLKWSNSAGMITATIIYLAAVFLGWAEMLN